MANSVILTVSSANADESKSVIITNISEKELQVLKELYTRYELTYTYIKGVGNGYTSDEVYKWLDEVRLQQTKYILTSEVSEVIQLPRGVIYSTEGYLEVCVVPSFKEHTHDTALQEVELMQWILQKFPTSNYVSARNRFTLPAHREEYEEDDKLTKYVVNISRSGDEAVIIRTQTYHKEVITL